MIRIRTSADRGFADHGWLKSRHSFSFADYHDPAHMGIGNLRVVNEDRIAPGTGFGTHAHRDMEIVSIVLDGALAHRDDLQAGAAEPQIIHPGDVQRMTAGTGVRHSEFNASPDRPAHFLQIWLLPSRRGLAPGYEQKHFGDAARRGRLVLVASADGRDGSVTLQADAALHVGRFDNDERADLALRPGRIGYVQVLRGSVRLNGHPLLAGDAAHLTDETGLVLDGGVDSEVLVFDLAP